MKISKPGSLKLIAASLLVALTACSTTARLPIEPSNQPANQPTNQQTKELTNTPTTQPTLTAKPPLLDLPDLGQAPEIHNNVWVNADAPVTLADSKGKVVLLEFWTFG